MDKKNSKIISLEDKQKIELNILRKVSSFCKKNNIKFFLTGGTLLGAVRHKGFIPWDDDIDIIMFRKDYERFISLFKDDDIFRLICFENDTRFYLPFAKIYDKRTILKEEVHTKVDLGINIDLFILDYCSDDFIECLRYYKRIRNIRKLYSIRISKLSKSRDFLKNILILLSRLIPKNLILRKVIRLAKMSLENKKYCANLSAMTYGDREFMLTEWYSEGVELEFEGDKYLCPKEYDKVLKSFYGDYMKLPPIEKRVGHHNSSAYWREI